MAITASDILMKLSTTAGSVGNSGTGAAGTSLGKYISTSAVTDATLGNLFLPVTGDQNAASQVDYQAAFVHNAHATLTMQSTVAWVSAETTGGAVAAIGVDTTAASPIGASTAQALTIASATTAPSGVSFSAPTTKGTGLSLGDIPAGSCRAFWVRRTTANTSAVDVDGAVFSIACDTAA